MRVNTGGSKHNLSNWKKKWLPSNFPALYIVEIGRDQIRKKNISQKYNSSRRYANQM